jgi:hypothetical protein
MIATGSIELHATVSYVASEDGIEVTGLSLFGINIPVSELTCEALQQCEDLAEDEHASYLRGLEETRHDGLRFAEAS